MIGASRAGKRPGGWGGFAWCCAGAENHNDGDQPGWKDEKKAPKGPALMNRRRDGIGRGRCVKTIKSTRCRGDKTQTQTQQPAAPRGRVTEPSGQKWNVKPPSSAPMALKLVVRLL